MKNFYSVRNGSILLFTKVIPNSSKDAIGTIEKSINNKYVLKLKVSAVPENNKANNAVIKLLSKQLDITINDFEISSGEKSKLKNIIIHGDIKEIENKLLSLIDN